MPPASSFASILGIILMSVALLGAAAAPFIMCFYHRKVMKDTSSPPDNFPEVKAHAAPANGAGQTPAAPPAPGFA
jgi:hypothetical protein